MQLITLVHRAARNLAAHDKGACACLLAGHVAVLKEVASLAAQDAERKQVHQLGQHRDCGGRQRSLLMPILNLSAIDLS